MNVLWLYKKYAIKYSKEMEYYVNFYSSDSGKMKVLLRGNFCRACFQIKVLTFEKNVFNNSNTYMSCR